MPSSTTPTQRKRAVVATSMLSILTLLAGPDIAEAGGNMEEIAGNDDIMLTALSDRDAVALADGERLITTVGRDGFGGYRHLIDVKVVDLADTIRTLAARSARLEHVYDY